ncbi:hypothetical protein FZEAL_9942, partial [Fusarium zealandicum]
MSIETKRPSKDLDAAQLQMAVWYAAQWRFLQSAVEANTRASGNPEAADDEALADKAKTALLELGFLPGVIISVHHWLFVFSTLEPHTTAMEDGSEVAIYRTILWVEQEFGSTKSFLKTYQISAGLRQLASWARDV